MGMYDHVNVGLPCPKCQTMVTDFQSKDGPCLMETVDVDEIYNFYSICPSCGFWIEYSRDRLKILNEKADSEVIIDLGFKLKENTNA